MLDLKLFYAGYNSGKTDIAVFETEEERNNWINNKYYLLDNFYERKLDMDEYLEDECGFYGSDERVVIPAKDINISNYEEYIDIFGIRWLVYFENYIV